jgi:hypothetical protein
MAKRRFSPEFQAILDAIAETFEIRIHPAEAELVTDGETMMKLVRNKVDAAGMGKRWPEPIIWDTLRGIIASQYHAWPEDVQRSHPLDRDGYDEDLFR